MADTSTAPPPQDNSQVSYIGSKVSIISKAEIRYEGILYHINTQEATLTLKDGRKNGQGEIEPDGKVYDYIAFSSSGIKDLYVSDGPTINSDPAVVETGEARAAPAPEPPSIYEDTPSIPNQGDYNSPYHNKYNNNNQGRYNNNYRRHNNNNYGRYNNNNSRGGGIMSNNNRHTEPIDRTEFDVQSSLEQFDKEKDKSEWLAMHNNTSVSGGIDGSNGSDSVIPQPTMSEDGTIKSTAYDKSSSFFDTLSTDAPKQTRMMNKQLNRETFGTTGSNNNNNYRGGRGGSGRYNSRGGYNNNYNNGGGRGRYNNNNYNNRYNNNNNNNNNSRGGGYSRFNRGGYNSNNHRSNNYESNWREPRPETTPAAQQQQQQQQQQSAPPPPF